MFSNMAKQKLGAFCTCGHIDALLYTVVNIGKHVHELIETAAHEDSSRFESLFAEVSSFMLAHNATNISLTFISLLYLLENSSIIMPLISCSTAIELFLMLSTSFDIDSMVSYPAVYMSLLAFGTALSIW